MTIILGVPKEFEYNEKRVSVIPDVVPRLINLGMNVLVESGSGEGAHFTDENYRDSGALVTENRQELFQKADIVAAVQCPPLEDISEMKPGSIFTGLLFPEKNTDIMEYASGHGLRAFALEKIPRTTRAQAMDVLSSQSTASGYTGAIIAAGNSPRMMPMLTTAAGTVKPSRVLVLGAGVAGLMAIATTRRLGAVVTAYDVRKAAGEEVKSLGAKFLDLGIEASSQGGYARELTDEEKRMQQEKLVGAMKDSDIIITTASVPGRKAPVLISEDTVKRLRPGTVIVDLSSDSGGNCEVTRPGTTIVVNGVKIIGVSNPPSHVAVNSSEMFSRNVLSFLQLLVEKGEIVKSFDDVILKECIVSGDLGGAK